MAKIENTKCLFGFVHGLGEFAVKQWCQLTQRYGLCSLTGKTRLSCEYSYIDIGTRSTISSSAKMANGIILTTQTRGLYCKRNNLQY